MSAHDASDLDSWAALNHPEPEDEDDFDECDSCGETAELDWHRGHLMCSKCRAAEEDEAADRGDHECHRERDA